VRTIGFLVHCVEAYFGYRPQQFAKKVSVLDESEDESTVGQMPPSDSEEE
jgi:hypothetical protein